jgi:hypothetical protein
VQIYPPKKIFLLQDFNYAIIWNMQLTEISNIVSMANGIVHGKSMQLNDMK